MVRSARGVNVGTTIKEEAAGLQEATFGGDVEEGCAAEGEQAGAGMDAI
jgi:hypothetical protein